MHDPEPGEYQILDADPNGSATQPNDTDITMDFPAGGPGDPWALNSVASGWVTSPGGITVLASGTVIG